MGDAYLQRPDSDALRVAKPQVTETAGGESQTGQSSELQGGSVTGGDSAAGQSEELVSPGGPGDGGPDASEAAAPPAAPVGTGEAYTVVSGDTLSGIARDHYGRPTLWRGIYQANESTIGSNPDLIQIGMQLTLPTVETIIGTNNHRATVQEAFEVRWNVDVDRERGAVRVPVGTFRRVHAELERLPAQDVEGTWSTLLHLDNSGGAYMSSDGEFGLGEDAATTGDQGFGTHGLALSADAATGATKITMDATSLVGPGVSIAIGEGEDAETVAITAINDERTEFTIDPALSKDHAAGEAVAHSTNPARGVVWLEAVVRHEIGHAVETAVGDISGFTSGLGDWTETDDFDTWIALMGNAWATNDGSVISESEKGEIKTVIDALRTAPSTAGLDDGLDPTHAIIKYWDKAVPVIEAAKPIADTGSDYWQSSENFYGTNGRFYTINDYYEVFHAFNNEVQYNQTRQYSTYSPAEFFAESYCVYYEEAGTESPDYGRLLPVTSWKTWITDNIHNRGHAPTPSDDTATGGP